MSSVPGVRRADWPRRSVWLAVMAGAIVLTLATIAGAWVAQSSSAVPEEVVRARLLEKIDATPPAMFFIRRNLLVMLFMLCGCVTFGLTAVVGLTATGATTGSAIALGLKSGLPMTAVLASLAPHGVFEIPAAVVAGGVGLLGLRSFVAMYHDRPAIEVDSRVLATTTLLVVVLIVIAGLVEAHVTPGVVAGVLSGWVVE